MRDPFSRPLLVAVVVSSLAPTLQITGQEPTDEAITLVGRARISAIYDIEAAPPYAYALERGVLHVLDMHDPGAVHEVGYLEFDHSRMRTELRFPYLYLTGFGAPMAVVDISDPTDPTWVGEFPEYRTRAGFPISGEVGYHVTKVDGGTDLMGTGPLILEILGLGGDPTHPRVVSRLDLGVVAVGHFGAIAWEAGRVFILVATPKEESQSRLVVVDARVP
jgi:hypothetical protein